MRRILSYRGWSVALGLAVAALAACVSKPALVSQSYSIDPPDPRGGPAADGARLLWLSEVEVWPPYGGVQFTFDSGNHAVERDPYARFAAPPGPLFTAAIRGYLLGADFVRDVETTGGSVAPDATIEAQVSELYADISGREAAAVLVLRFRVLAPAAGTASKRELLLKTYSRRESLPEKSARAAASGWNAELEDIMKDFLADLKAVLPPRRSAG